jgi:tetratricopeptide (TPR) repeat protein
MKISAWVLLLFLAFTGGFAAAQERPPSDAQREDAEQAKLLQEGVSLLQARRAQDALASFDRVISFYEAKYRDSAEQIYCARTTVETLFYLTKHANQNPKKNARVVRVWCDAQFLKGYALVELGRIADAKASLETAVRLSPAHSPYLSELGNVHLREKNWPKALEVYQAAEEAAELADAQVKQTYLARAHRGVGYALIELDRLDEAEAKYRRSVELDPADKLARSQLEYIAQLRAKRAGR